MKMEKLKQDVKNYQLHAGKTYMQYEQDRYSSYQNYLYKRALYGLDALTQQELATMCSKKKQRIINVYKRAQVILNKFKQQVTIQYTNFIFKTLFPKSPITDVLLADTEIDEKFKNTLTFKELGISKDQIITIFIAEGILPKNFLSLDRDPNQLPRLRNEVKSL
jgi:fructose-bisphosphate aldolase class 1